MNPMNSNEHYANPFYQCTSSPPLALCHAEFFFPSGEENSCIAFDVNLLRLQTKGEQQRGRVLCGKVYVIGRWKVAREKKFFAAKQSSRQRPFAELSSLE
jgi:hypothetical protein